MYTVLIVDDEAIQREYLRLQIPALDPRFAVAGEAADGQEALEFLEERSVDLVMTDIKMPVMNGLELCKELQARHPRIKVVILSGYEEFEFVRDALQYRAEQYLLKPLNRDAMRRTLRDVAGRLERIRADEAAQRGLQALSQEGMKHIGRRLLQALIAGAEAEVGSLFPLAYRMKIPLFEGEGLILLLAIDDDSLRDKSIPRRDWSIFHYILNQIAAELCERRELVWTMFDDRERTAVLLSGTETDSLQEDARALYAAVRDNMRLATGLAITGGLGEQIEDVLQLELSYRSALAASGRGIRCGGDRLYEAGEDAEGIGEASGQQQSGPRIPVHRITEDRTPDGRTSEERPERSGAEIGERKLAEEIRRFIEVGYAEPISLSLLSDKFHASPQHISTVFHKHIGTPYVKYMTRVRMDNAARLLAGNPEMRVVEVAERIGYANVKHFTYVFKKHFGKTPGEYRPD
ncbi:response regulator transcription factor [Cohnella fermenti]|nr:response regulator [Cohnella fermenti]